MYIFQMVWLIVGIVLLARGSRCWKGSGEP